MLLAGMALSTAFTMLLMMLQASGDPRMAQILTWISGSTYSATPELVMRSGAVMLILLALTPLCRRWLTILPLGGEAARAVGMALTPSRIGLLLLAACRRGRNPNDWPAQLRGVNGAAYCAYDGIPAYDAAYGDLRPDWRSAAGVCRLVRPDADVPAPNPGRIAVDVYRRAVLYLSVEKAEPVAFHHRDARRASRCYPLLPGFS
jgi:iron complex transport system permease protein